jgi:hypothetical protein
MPATDKHSSFFEHSYIANLKSFITLGPGGRSGSRASKVTPADDVTAMQIQDQLGIL